MLGLEIHLLKRLSLHLVVSLRLQVIDLVSRTKSALDLQHTDEDSESNFNCKSVEMPAPKNKDRVSNLQTPASQLALQAGKLKVLPRSLSVATPPPAGRAMSLESSDRALASSFLNGRSRSRDDERATCRRRADSARHAEVMASSRLRAPACFFALEGAHRRCARPRTRRRRRRISISFFTHPPRLARRLRLTGIRLRAVLEYALRNWLGRCRGRG